MSKNISEMTDQELNDAVAIEVMGWHKQEDGICWITSDDRYTGFLYKKIADEELIGIEVSYWDPTHDLNQCMECHRIILFQLHNEEYLTAFDIVVWHPFGKVHATARQRCIAMLMAVRDSK